MLRIALALCFLLSPFTSASAVVGGAPEVRDAKTQPEVMLVGQNGFCSGVAIAPDFVLTAAHCVPPGSTYKLYELTHDRKVILKDIRAIARHPQFSMKNYQVHLATADVALVKLAAALPVASVPLLAPRPRIAVGERFMVRGYGAAIEGDPKSAGNLRQATLAATGKPGNLQLRLVDPAGGGTRQGLGACEGDSGAPVYQDNGGALALYGLVSWSTGPNAGDGCGGLTGVTPLELYRPWIVEQVRKMGSNIPQ